MATKAASNEAFYKGAQLSLLANPFEYSSIERSTSSGASSGASSSAPAASVLLRWEGIIFRTTPSTFGTAVKIPDEGIGGNIINRSRSSTITNECILLADSPDVIWIEAIAHTSSCVRAIVVADNLLGTLQERWGASEFSFPVLVIHAIDMHLLLHEGALWATLCDGLTSFEAGELLKGEFLAAAMRNDVSAVKAMLRKGARVNSMDERLRNAMLLATKHGAVAMNEESHQQLLATLVEHRINIQHCDMLGMTVLHYAAKNFNLCSLKLALAAGVDPELTDEHDQACLELVCLQGWAPAARILCEAGASQRTEEGIESKVYRSAVFSNNCELLRVLYDHRALWLRSTKAHAEGGAGRSSDGLLIDVDLGADGSVLLYAIKFRLMEMIDTLLAEYKDMYSNTLTIADANSQTSQGRTALMEACIWGQAELVRKLMRYCQGWRTPWVYGGLTPCSLGLVDDTGKTALMYAVLKGHIAVVQELADVSNREVNHLVPQCKQRTELTMRDGDVSQRSLKVNEQDDLGRTALHYTAVCPIERPEIVRILLVELNADTSIADLEGQLPLHLAAARGRISIVKTIIQHGEINHQQTNHRGQSALHTAVIAGNLSIISFLLESKARVNLADLNGMTPLPLAFTLQHQLRVSEQDEKPEDEAGATDAVDQKELAKREQVVVMLLEAGGDLGARDNHGCTPFTEDMQRMHYQQNKELCSQVVVYERRRNNKLTVMVMARNVQRRVSMSMADMYESTVARVVPTSGAETTSTPLFGSAAGPPEESEQQPQNKGLERSWSAASFKRKFGDTYQRILNWRRRNAVAQERPELEYKEAFRDIRMQKAVEAQWQAEVRRTSLFDLMVFTIFLLSYLVTGLIRSGFNTPELYEHEHAYRRNTIEKEWDVHGSTFVDVASAEDLYGWFHGSFISMVEYTSASDFSAGVNKYQGVAAGTYLLEYAKVIGTPRISQWRHTDPSNCVHTSGLSGPGATLGSERTFSCGFSEGSRTNAAPFGPRPFRPWRDNGHEGNWTPSDADIRALGWGQAFEWRPVGEIQQGSIPGRFRTYNGGSYSVELDLSSTGGLRNLTSFLQENDWIDGATHTVIVELTTYNRNAGLFCRLRYIFERPASAGVFVPTYTFRTAMLSPYDLPTGPTLLAVEVVTVLLMLYYFFQELKEFRADGPTIYFGRLANIRDFVYQTLFFVQLCMGSAYPFLLQQVDWTDPLLNVDHLFDYQKTRQIIYTINLGLMWSKFLVRLQAFQSMAMFILTLELMLYKLFDFLIVAGFVLFGFSVCDNILHSFQRESSRSLWNSVSSKWDAAFWQDADGLEHELFHEGTSEAYWSTFIDGVFVVIVSVLLMNFLITLLVDKYDEVKAEAAIRWCFIQAQGLHDIEMRSRPMNSHRMIAKAQKALQRMKSQEMHSYKISPDDGRSGKARTNRTASAMNRKKRAFKKRKQRQRRASHSQFESSKLKTEVEDFCLQVLKQFDGQGKRLSTSWFRTHLMMLYPELSFVQDLMSNNDQGGTQARGSDRAAMKAAVESMERVFLLLTTTHEQFTEHDKSPLTVEQFVWARRLLQRFVRQDAMMLDVVLTTLACVSAGKLESFRRDVFDESGDYAVDSDTVCLIAVSKCIHLLPSVKRQGAEQRQLIQLYLLSEFNLGQFTQAENAPATLNKLLVAAGDKSDVLLISCVVWMFRIPPALHIRPIFLNIRGALENVLEIKQLGAKGVYESFLKAVAAKSDVDYSRERHIVRLGCMMRMTNGKQIQQTFGLLSKQLQQVLRSELARTGIDDGIAITCTFAPDLLRNIKDSASGSKRDDGLFAGLVLLARIFLMVRSKLDSKGVAGDGVHRCSLKGIASLQKELSPDIYLKMSLGLEFLGQESVLHYGSSEAKVGAFRCSGMRAFDIPELPSASSMTLRVRSRLEAKDGFNADSLAGTGSVDENIVVFIEGIDPANLVCVLAAHFMLIKRETDPSWPSNMDRRGSSSDRRRLHVVLVGRQVDLRARCLTPPLVKKEFEKGKSMKDLLKAGAGLKSRASDSRAVMNDLAVRLQTFLSSAGVQPDAYTLYNGGVAPTAMISHEMHQREFLFDRADLSSTGACGDIVDSGSYWKIISRSNGMDPDEKAAELLQVLRRPSMPIEPLLELSERLLAGGATKMIVGGPMTGLKALLELGGQALADKVTGVYATMGSWDIGKEGAKGLFNNQFNIGKDIDAAAAMLCAHGPQTGSSEPIDSSSASSPSSPPIELRCGVHLVPTETTKHPQLALTPEELHKHKPPSQVQLLYELWYELNQKRPFFLFDLAPVLAAHEEYQAAIFRFRACRCTLNSSGTLTISQAAAGVHKANGGPICAADRQINAEGATAYFQALDGLFAAIKRHAPSTKKTNSPSPSLAHRQLPAQLGGD